MDHLSEINETIKFLRWVPNNKWDRGKYTEMFEKNLNEAEKRLDAHKIKVSDFETKCRSRGVEESEIQNNVYHNFSNEHIQLLQGVISAKKTLAMMHKGTIANLTHEKIKILEELATKETCL